MARPVRFSSDDILDGTARTLALRGKNLTMSDICLLYTSDAADDMQCVDLGGRRIIKKS